MEVEPKIIYMFSKPGPKRVGERIPSISWGVDEFSDSVIITKDKYFTFSKDAVYPDGYQPDEPNPNSRELEYLTDYNREHIIRVIELALRN